MADRRRINGPPGGTSAPIFSPPLASAARQSTASSQTNTDTSLNTSQTSSSPQDIRKICKSIRQFDLLCLRSFHIFTQNLKKMKKESNNLNANIHLLQTITVLRTGLISSTSGSSFLEISPYLKLSVSVLGPRPLPRSSSTPFTPHAILTTEVKFAPFASPARRGYVRDSSERDLSLRLYQALVGSIRTELYPKSRIEIVVTVLDSEGRGGGGDNDDGNGYDEQTSVLAGCITAASAALADAGIELFDLVAGGVAAVVEDEKGNRMQVLDPRVVTSTENKTRRIATCVVGYMASRDEITELWMMGKMEKKSVDSLMDAAVEAATKATLVLKEAAAERVKFIVQKGGGIKALSKDVEMTG